MSTIEEGYASIDKEREQELRAMTAKELHLRLSEDIAITSDLEDKIIVARNAEAQSQAILNQLLREKGGAVVYFPDIGEASCEGVLLTFTNDKRFETKRVLLNPKFAAAISVDIIAASKAEEEFPAPGAAIEVKPNKSFRKISRQEADRRRALYISTKGATGRRVEEDEENDPA